LSRLSPLLARERRLAVLWAVAGAVVGVLWPLAVPVASTWSEGYERQLDGDATLAVLLCCAGGAVALHALWRRSGPGSAGRFVESLLGSTLASAVAWGTGGALGAPALVSTAVLAFWPLTIAFVTVVWTMVATLVTREEY
jgi:hypothetical protein